MLIDGQVVHPPAYPPVAHAVAAVDAAAVENSTPVVAAARIPPAATPHAVEEQTVSLHPPHISMPVVDNHNQVSSDTTAIQRVSAGTRLTPFPPYPLTVPVMHGPHVPRFERHGDEQRPHWTGLAFEPISRISHPFRSRAKLPCLTRTVIANPITVITVLCCESSLLHLSPSPNPNAVVFFGRRARRCPGICSVSSIRLPPSRTRSLRRRRRRRRHPHGVCVLLCCLG